MEVSKKFLIGAGLSVIAFAVMLSSAVTFIAVSSIHGGTGQITRGQEFADSEQESFGDDEIAQVHAEVIPEEGKSTDYSDIDYEESSMDDMIDWYQSIEPEGEDLERVVEIGTTEGTACEFCCSLDEALTEEGRSPCGCGHNYAIGGLIKYLVTETDMSNQEILDEVDYWKGYFFPQQMLQRELDERGISAGQAGLPQMRGGC